MVKLFVPIYFFCNLDCITLTYNKGNLRPACRRSRTCRGRELICLCIACLPSQRDRQARRQVGCLARLGISFVKRPVRTRMRGCCGGWGEKNPRLPD